MQKTKQQQYNQKQIRNIAIIAHVDHGKTTLVDAFLKQTHTFRENQLEMQQELIMDSGELEREKGITIKAKNASVYYKEFKVNIIDTPGHADFGGEVERTLNMAEGCLLLVDAQEGPMPQTKFVLKKALELGLKPIVVVNKIDKKNADPRRALSRVQDLFLQLATDPDQLDFPVFYAIGREGMVFTELPAGDLTDPKKLSGNIFPLLDEIISRVPAPEGDPNGPFQMQVTSMEYDNHQGRYLIGKIKRGSVKLDDPVVLVHGQEADAKKESGRIKKILVRVGLKFEETDGAGTGEIVAVAGIDSVAIGGTICAHGHIDPLPTIKISPPSVKIKFEANTSPFVGKEGTFVTARQLQERLDREAENNIGLKITKEAGGYYVAGRGELQLSILIETLRREGYEFQVRRPEVLFKEENGVKLEPQEEVVIDVPKESISVVTQSLSTRHGELENMEEENGQVRFTYKILTRNLLGLRRELLTATKGNVIMNNFLLDYVPYTNQPEIARKGVIISTDTGTSAGYALNTIQERGTLLVGPGVEVYEGMIIGINKYDMDLEANPTKTRHQSAVRMKHDEITQTNLKQLMDLNLDFALCFLAKDEMLEVTPENLRLRKILLSHTQREWSKRKSLADYARQQMNQAAQ